MLEVALRVGLRTAIGGVALWVMGGVAMTGATVLWVGTPDTHRARPVRSRPRGPVPEQHLMRRADERFRSAWDMPDCLLCDG